MRYLQLDYVDLFSFHGINTTVVLDQVMRKGGCMEIGKQLQREGRVRHLGFSTHAPTSVILDAIRTDEFDYVNLHWYFVNDFNWPAVQEATRHDMGVFIISPNDKGGMLYAPSPKLVRLCEPLSPMIFNDLYCLNRPEVHTLSIGASKPSDFDEHIAAVQLIDKGDELVPPIEARLRGELDRVLGADWVRNWPAGLPEHDQLPGSVNLLEIFRLWNFAKALDLVEFGRMRYNLLGNAGHWFPGQNAADFDELALKKALASYAYVDRVPSILREAHEMLKAEAKKRLSEGG
jgi:predicted aldo/keto reductase-like oxidoreductase